MKNIPNILSSIRLLLVAVFAVLFSKEIYVWCIIVFAVAFLTDLLDGWLARRNNWITDVGKVLDPLADKLMMICAVVCFAVAGMIPLWMMIVTIVKEMIMIIGGALLYKKKIVVFADWFGKFAAGFYNASVLATLAKCYWPTIGKWNLVLFIIAIALAYIALCHYGLQQIRFMKRNAKSERHK